MTSQRQRHDDQQHGRAEDHDRGEHGEPHALQARADDRRRVGHVVGEVEDVAQGLDPGGGGPDRHQRADAHQARVRRVPDLVDRGPQARRHVGRQEGQAQLDGLPHRVALADGAGQGQDEDQEGEDREHRHVGDVAGEHEAVVLAEVVGGEPQHAPDPPQRALGRRGALPVRQAAHQDPRLADGRGRDLDAARRPQAADWRRRRALAILRALRLVRGCRHGQGHDPR